MGKKVSDDLILRVKELAGYGLSARRIAAELLITRNSVIGIAARYGQKHNFKLARQDTSPKRKRRRRKREPRPSDTVPLVPGIQAPTLPNDRDSPYFVMMTLVMVHDGQRCHYPVTEGRAPYLYCGAPTDDTLDTYCPYHARVCINTTPRPMPHVVYDW